MPKRKIFLVFLFLSGGLRVASGQDMEQSLSADERALVLRVRGTFITAMSDVRCRAHLQAEDLRRIEKLRHVSDTVHYRVNDCAVIKILPESVITQKGFTPVNCVEWGDKDRMRKEQER